MRFQSLIQSIKYAIMRFPLEILFACIGTIAGLISVKTNSSDLQLSEYCLSVLMTANIGLVVSLSVSLHLESKGIRGSRQILIKCAAALLAASLVFLLKPIEQDFIRFFLLSLAGHLLVSFSAFIYSGSTQGFWQFNEVLFIRLLSGILYSIILFIGLSAAFATTQFLFNVNLGSLAYINLFILISGIFHTFFFLAGIPKDLNALNTDFTYPKALKLFTQYVLIPLAIVYLVILLAYEAKILIEWNLPKGLVSSLILGYAIFGILSLLLVYPIREQDENKWIKTYSRSFYLLMLPLLILLFLAIGIRVYHYGITEYRYFLIMLALWLVLITVYSLVSQKQNIKLIPVSLFFFVLFSVYGPQSAISVSTYSQRNILREIFNRNNALKDGKVLPAKTMSQKDGTRAAQLVRHLVERYGYTAIQPLIVQDLSKVSDSLTSTQTKTKPSNRYILKEHRTTWLLKHLGLNGFNSYGGKSFNENINEDEVYFLKNSQAGIKTITGYDYLLKATIWNENVVPETDDMEIDIHTAFRKDGILTVRIDKDSTVMDLKKIMTDRLKNISQLNSYKEIVANNSDQQYNLPPGLLRTTQETKNYKVTFQIDEIRLICNKNRSIKSIAYAEGVLLIKRLP